ncbi:hypothetical protein SAMN05444159_1755 [Bradyrhizobium lablabi]|uniref:Uncharacterized protein n=1 Tax=Bradyrhizobium lablabi TaxID=722472 RepID=A0A1M6MVK1_9BRAD|nr:hypothetical protein [Bradyrhizobium lablabi]SHJ87409.1 hypothetical protein SAMN05444159_1755 [Bradyrhizobium lablabi]
MHSTLKPRQADDPHDVVAVAPDAPRFVPAVEELSKLLRAAALHQAAPQAHRGADLAAHPPVPPVDTTFRPTAVNNVQDHINVQDHFHVAGSPRTIGSRLARAFAALLLATCIGVASIVWRAHGDAVLQIVKSAPQLLSSLLPLEKPAPSAEPAAPAAEADAAAANADAAPPQAAPPQATPPQAAPSQATPPAQAVAESAVPTAAASSPDQSQLLQSMARDLAGLGQQVEQLKASIEEIKAGQQQMSRDVAKASEQNVRPKVSAITPLPPPTRPAAARPRKPITPLPPPQAAMPPPPAAAPYVPPATAAPYAPRQSDYVPRQVEPPPQATAQPQDEELSAVPRPPMPVR